MLAAQWGKTVAAMPVVSYSALSGRPPLFGVACAKGSFTLRTISLARRFSVCLLDEERVLAVTKLASGHGAEGIDKLASAGLRHRKGTKLGAPVILGSVASLECSLQKSLRTGDHVLLIGRIEEALASEDFRGYWRFWSYRPMLYSGWKRGVTLYQPINRRKR